MDKRIQEQDQDDRTEFQGKRLKSRSVRHQENHVKVYINWPHEFCYSSDRTCPAYDDLTVMQFSQGFIGCILTIIVSGCPGNKLVYSKICSQNSVTTDGKGRYRKGIRKTTMLLEMERGGIGTVSERQQ